MDDELNQDLLNRPIYGPTTLSSCLPDVIHAVNVPRAPMLSTTILLPRKKVG